MDHDAAPHEHTTPEAVAPSRPITGPIARLIADGTLDAALAALVWLLVEARTPLIVAAQDPAAGASVVGAFLALLPDGWIDAGWIDPGSGEHGGRGWSAIAREAVRAIGRGAGVMASVRADSLEAVFALFGDPDVGLAADEASRLGVVLVLGAVPDAGGGRPREGVVAAHYVRPLMRDAGGHLQRLAPAVLATRDGTTDTFEHFAWGVMPELAARTGRRPGDVERELERRVPHLRHLAAAVASA